MAAFGTAATLIQQSEFTRCQSKRAEADVAFQEDITDVAEVDAESLAAAKQVQADMQKAIHAALSANLFLLLAVTHCI